MSARTRLKLVILLGALAVVVTGAALAWACTPQAYMSLGPGPNAPTTPRDGDYFMPGEEVTRALAAELPNRAKAIVKGK